MGSPRQSGAIPTCINAPIQPRGDKVMAEAPTVVPKGSVQESRGKQTEVSISCVSNNVTWATKSGVRAPENSGVDSAVKVQRWLHCGGDGSVDPTTLELMCKLEQQL